MLFFIARTKTSESPCFGGVCSCLFRRRASFCRRGSKRIVEGFGDAQRCTGDAPERLRVFTTVQSLQLDMRPPNHP